MLLPSFSDRSPPSYNDATSREFLPQPNSSFSQQAERFSSSQPSDACSPNSQKTSNAESELPESKPLKVKIGKRNFKLKTATPKEAASIECTPIPTRLFDLIHG